MIGWTCTSLPAASILASASRKVPQAAVAAPPAGTMMEDLPLGLQMRILLSHTMTMCMHRFLCFVQSTALELIGLVLASSHWMPAEFDSKCNCMCTPNHRGTLRIVMENTCIILYHSKGTKAKCADEANSKGCVHLDVVCTVKCRAFRAFHSTASTETHPAPLSDTRKNRPRVFSPISK